MYQHLLVACFMSLGYYILYFEMQLVFWVEVVSYISKITISQLNRAHEFI